MSHFLKQKVTTFLNMKSLTNALMKVGGEQNVVSEGSQRQTISIYGNRSQQADILCKRRGFKTLYDFGYLKENQEINCVCDSMDRHRIQNIEQQALPHYLAVETQAEVEDMGFTLQDQTVGPQQQVQLTFSRWR